MKLRNLLRSETPRYFIAKLPHSASDVFYTLNGNVFSWGTGKSVTLDANMKVEPIAVPPQPLAPAESWVTCLDTSRSEILRGFREYVRQIEACTKAHAVHTLELEQENATLKNRLQELTSPELEEQ